MKKERMQEISEYIVNCTFEELCELSGKTLSKKFEISASQLSSEFKKQKKITLSLFILQVKLTRSIHLMFMDPELTINEISEKIGYENSIHYGRIFKQNFGVSPGK